MEREGKVSHKVTKGYISAIRGADHLGPISTKIGRIKGAHDVIIVSNFGFNIFRGFRSTGSQRFPLTLLVIVTTVLPLPRSL